MDKNLIKLIDKIRNFDGTLIYSSFRNLFKYINSPFHHFDIIVGHRPLFRVRTHTDGDGKYFYNNESELSYPPDITTIDSFGRCNEPLQSLFYASDDSLISFSEVLTKEKIENLKDISYLTTGVWNFTKDVMVAPILEPDNVDITNPSLVNVTKKCQEYLDSFDVIPQKEELKTLLKGMAAEFTKPFSLDKNAYLFSAAYTNYMFDTIGIDDKQIEGIMYPTCKGIPEIRHLGINYVFKKSIIGFGKKLELVDAFRTQLVKDGKHIFETDRIHCKLINKINGTIVWP